MTDDGPPAARDSRGDARVEPFAEQFRRHEEDVARVCRRMLRGVLDGAAEDASGEVFLRARRAFDSYDASRPFRPWLLGVAGNYCIDLLRRHAVESRLFDPREASEAALADPGPSPLRRLLRAEQRTALLEAVDALDPMYRLPLMLRYFSELDYNGIAGVLGVSPGQVGSLLFRARHQLRARLTGGAIR